MTAEAYEQKLIAMDYAEAERQIKEGRAAATTINHFLKLGSQRDKLEQAKLEAETKLAEQKIAEIAAAGCKPPRRGSAHRVQDILGEQWIGLAVTQGSR